MRASELLLEFYDPADDELAKAELSDTRRPRITLRHLNKIRRMRDVEREDKKAHLLIIKQVYNAGAAPDEGGGL